MMINLEWVMDPEENGEVAIGEVLRGDKFTLEGDDTVFTKCKPPHNCYAHHAISENYDRQICSTEDNFFMVTRHIPRKEVVFCDLKMLEFYKEVDDFAICKCVKVANHVNYSMEDNFGVIFTCDQSKINHRVIPTRIEGGKQYFRYAREGE